MNPLANYNPKIMFCPECGSEYREGVLRCSDCDVALVAEFDGTGEHLDGALVPLVHEQSSELVAELLDRLEKAGVPYVVQAGTALALIDKPELEAIDEPDPWQARVWISAGMRDRAKRILADVDTAYGRRRLTDS